jgi:hemoglobin
MTVTAFERAGGFAKLRQVVADLYDRALESEALAHHFADIDMRVLIDHQTKFIASLMGGPASFTDEALRRAHVRLNITRDEFAAMAELLRETLEDHDFQPADVDFVIGEFRRREACIVTQGGRAASAAETAR